MTPIRKVMVFSLITPSGGKILEYGKVSGFSEANSTVMQASSTLNKAAGTTLEELKSKVRAMMAERENIPDPFKDACEPSQYWRDFCAHFDYMFELPEKSFQKLRLHTYHLTGDNYQPYYFGDANHFRAAWKLDDMVKDLPPRLILNEPEGGIGYFYKDTGRFVSYDTVRFQRIVSALNKHGIFSELSERAEQRRNFILEIGGGYGGLAHHLQEILPNTTYVLIDLPEALLFSSAYLYQHNPKKNIYLYDRTTLTEAAQPEKACAYDFMLIPNYQLTSLNSLTFNLALNIASFQEMRDSQVIAYLDFIRHHCDGILFSSNADCNPRNNELTSLFGLLKERFNLREVTLPLKESAKLQIKAALKSLAVKTGLLGDGYKEGGNIRRSADFICKPLADH